MHFGISDIGIFFPQNYLDLKILVEERTKENFIWKEKLERALKTTGQTGLRFPYKDQDSVVLAAEAFYQLLEQSPRDLSLFRILVGGTETGVDHSKSVTNYLIEALWSAGIQLPTSHASFQVQNACAGGMYGVFSALALLQTGYHKIKSDWGVVIATDIARYDTPSTAEITQGAGGAAVLLEENPKLLRVDLSCIGYSSNGVDDFFRPIGSLTAKVKGRYSVECFNSAFRFAFLNFCERKQSYPKEVLTSVCMIVLHTPYANMPEIALKTLLREFYSEDATEIEDYLDSRYIRSSTQIASQVGNLYTASLFVSLVGGLKAMQEKIGSEIVGKRVLIASYGSGNTMIVSEMIIAPMAPYVIENWKLESILASKTSVRWEDYLDWLDQKGSLMVSSPDTGFYLKEIREDGYRLYDKKKSSEFFRKESHWDICLNKRVESGKTGFLELSLKPRALTQQSLDRIQTSQDFLEHELSLPFFISCMTGGMAHAKIFNRSLARLANKLGIPMGLGSHKVLRRQPEVFSDFQVKKEAKDVPLFSNIGAVQLTQIPFQWLIEINKKLEVQAQVVHLNALQELSQLEGDRNFAGVREAIQRFVEISPLPIIIKETGGGIRSSEVEWLLSSGVAYVDIAGAGGTNWGLVEGYRGDDAKRDYIQRNWTDWGIPSAYTLYNLAYSSRMRTLTSGGMCEPLASVKAIAMGSRLVGFARPILLAWKKAGTEGILSFFRDQEKTLKEAMVLLDVSNLEELSKGDGLVIPESFEKRAILWN